MQNSNEEQIKYLSKSKYKELEDELEYLKKTRRKEVADTLEHARSLGDLSENAEYNEARELQAQIEDRIKELEEILKLAKIVSRPQKGEVEVGSTVTLQKKGEKTTKKYQVVETEEADIEQNKISYLSPLGKAMMGRKKEEMFSFISPNGGEIKYKIIDIE